MLGQNTDELLMEIGLDAADIRLLRHEGVV
jgi:hypothetical protein